MSVIEVMEPFCVPLGPSLAPGSQQGRLVERLLDVEEGQSGVANIPRPGEGGKDRCGKSLWINVGVALLV